MKLWILWTYESYELIKYTYNVEIVYTVNLEIYGTYRSSNGHTVDSAVLEQGVLVKATKKIVLCIVEVAVHRQGKSVGKYKQVTI